MLLKIMSIFKNNLYNHLQTTRQSQSSTCSFVVFKGFRFFAPDTSSSPPPDSIGGN